MLIIGMVPKYSSAQDTFNKIVNFQNHDEELASLIQIDSFYYFTGGALETNSTNDSVKLIVLKVQKNGNILDSMNFQFDSISNGGEYNSNNIIPWNSEGFCLAGSFQNKYLDTQNGAVIKFTDFSQPPEIIKYNFDSTEVFFSLSLKANNFYISGMSNSFGNGRFDYYLLKSDTLGNIINDTIYGGIESEYFGNSIKIDNSSFAFCGRTFSDANQRVGYAINAANAQFIAVDSNFNQLWNTVLYTPGVDAVPMLKDFGFFHYFAEYPVTPTEYREDFIGLIGQIDLSNGNLLWLDTIKIKEEIYAPKFIETVDSNSFVVFLEVESSELPYGYAKVIKYNDQGQIVWERAYYEGNHSGCYLNTMMVDDDGYLVFGGTIANEETQSQDAWLLKLRPDGCLDDTDCGIVTGIIDLTPGRHTFGVSVFPNPSTKKAYITVENTANYKHEVLDLFVYDYSGKLVHSGEQLLQGQIPIFNLDVSEFNSGSYVVQTCVRGKECGSSTMIVD